MRRADVPVDAAAALKSLFVASCKETRIKQASHLMKMRKENGEEIKKREDLWRKFTGKATWF